MLEAKKYFSIVEVSKFTGLLPHRLRYLEKIDPKIKITYLRGRRYYTKENIDYIQKLYASFAPNINHQYIKRIDDLISKFTKITSVISK